MTADRPAPEGLPAIYTSAHLYFGGAPRLTYTYAPTTNTHGIRIDSRAAGAFIGTTSDEEARRLLSDLEFVARELRRRLDLPSAA